MINGTSTEEELDQVTILIKDNINNGVYDSVSDRIVSIRYVETSPNPPDSNNADGGNGNDTLNGEDPASRDLRVGLFVSMTVLAVILAGVLYRTRRNMRGSDDQTDLQTNVGGSALQTASLNINDPEIASESYDAPSPSYDTPYSYNESPMAMADTGMDSQSEVSSDDGRGLPA
jgi:hypothetical protein